MIYLAYPVTKARETKFSADPDLAEHMTTLGLTKFDGGVENGLHTLSFTGSKEAEEAFMREPELRKVELLEVAGFPVEVYQKERAI